MYNTTHNQNTPGICILSCRRFPDRRSRTSRHNGILKTLHLRTHSVARRYWRMGLSTVRHNPDEKAHVHHFRNYSLGASMSYVDDSTHLSLTFFFFQMNCRLEGHRHDCPPIRLGGHRFHLPAVDTPSVIVWTVRPQSRYECHIEGVPNIGDYWSLRPCIQSRGAVAIGYNMSLRSHIFLPHSHLRPIYPMPRVCPF